MRSSTVGPWLLPGRPAAAPAVLGWLPTAIADPPLAVRGALVESGLVLARAGDVPEALPPAAEAAIDLCGGLRDVVARAVGAVHPLRAPPGYDVSHSEPRWTDRVFVSVPDRGDAVGALRFAEGVIHEALHLELTHQELVHPLVADGSGRMSSPWRAELRPPGGVMHGFFVFACLLDFFRTILPKLDGEAARHVAGRVHDVAAELDAVNAGGLADAMTPFGVGLLRGWISVAGAAGDL